MRKIVAAFATLVVAGTMMTVTGSGPVQAAADLAAPTSTSPQAITLQAATPLLTGVRTGAHATFDRVVFDVPSGVTGAQAEYVPQLIADGSGKVLPILGTSIVQVVLHGVSAHDEAGKPTAAPALLTPELANLRQVRLSGDFEATVGYGLGLRHKAGFRIFALTNPNRIVVDVAH
jgi:hypothetical protein